MLLYLRIILIINPYYYTKMKRSFILTLVMALGFVGVISCNSTDKPSESKPPIFKFVSKYNLTFSAEGGEGSVRYSIQNPVEGAQVEYLCASDWVTNISTVDSVTFTILPNEEEVSREAVITVKYVDQSLNIMITQEGYKPPYDVHFEAKAFNSTYYGRQESEGFNYFIILSENGVTHESGYDYGYVYYRLDLYSDQTGFFDPTLPDGEYVLDSRNTGDPGTIASEFSIYLDTTNGEVEQIGYTDGTVVVENGTIKAWLTLYNGQVHYVTYSGPMEPGYPNIDDDAIMSTFNQDIHAEVTGGGLDCYYRGDYHGVGYDCWLINMIEDVSSYSGEYIQFEVMVERSESGMIEDSFLGEYQIYEFPSENFLGTFLPGSLQNGFHPKHSWYSRCVDGILDNSYRGPLVGGSVKISKSGATYKIEYDCVDDKNNKLSGTFSGTIRYSFDQSSL